jgi:hypothetical protein
MAGDVERTQRALKDVAVAQVPSAWRDAVLGIAYDFRGDSKAAERCLERAREADPDSYWIASAYVRLLANHDWERFLRERENITVQPRDPLDYLIKANSEAWVTPTTALETFTRAAEWRDTAYGSAIRMWI